MHKASTAAICEYIDFFASVNGYPPNYIEIADAIQCSPQTVAKNIRILVQEGYLEKGVGERAYKVVKPYIDNK